MTGQKRLKVLVATDYFTPHWTGIVKAIANVTRSLEEEIDFTVLTVRYAKVLPAEETIGRVRVVRAEPMFMVSRAFYSLHAIARFWSLMKTHDHALINSPCSNVLPYSIIARVFGKRLMIFHQGDLKLRRSLFNRIVEGIFFSCTYLSCWMADAVSTYTEDYARNSALLGRFLKKFRPLLIPIYVKKTPEKFPAAVSPLVALKQQKKVIFGFAGRFVHEKGFDLLFDAIPEILRHVPDAHFVFAGEVKIAYEDFYTETAAKLERVKEHVTVLGLLPESDLWAFYNEIDFILIPSRSDCFNLVQMEAGLRGKPAVVSDIPGARHMVASTGFGKICRSEDPLDLARKVIELFNEQAAIKKNSGKVKDFLDFESARAGWRKALSGDSVHVPLQRGSFTIA